MLVERGGNTVLWKQPVDTVNRNFSLLKRMVGGKNSNVKQDIEALLNYRGDYLREKIVSLENNVDKITSKVDGMEKMMEAMYNRLCQSQPNAVNAGGDGFM